MSSFNRSLEEKISESAIPIIENHDAFLIEVMVRGSQQGKIIEIFIDNDKGITTGICAEISRLLKRELDASRIIQGRYFLVVSSPGTDRPLVYLRQYPKHIGRGMTVIYKNDEGTRTVEGTLKEVTDKTITLETEKEVQVVINFDSIVKAKVHTAI